MMPSRQFIPASAGRLEIRSASRGPLSTIARAFGHIAFTSRINRLAPAMSPAITGVCSANPIELGSCGPRRE